MPCCKCCCEKYPGAECCGPEGSKVCCKPPDECCGTGESQVCCPDPQECCVTYAIGQGESEVCCGPTQYCCTPGKGICCEVGDTCCEGNEASVCCTPEQECCNGICCEPGETCCGSEVNPVCCPEGVACVDGECAVACNNNGDCPEGSCCIDNECIAKECCSQPDCAGVFNSEICSFDCVNYECQQFLTDLAYWINTNNQQWEFFGWVNGNCAGYEDLARANPPPNPPWSYATHVPIGCPCSDDPP